MASESTKDARVGPWERLYAVWLRAVAPRASGLPNALVFWAFPALVLLVAAILTALQISGTSSGVHWTVLGQGADPRLLDGVPRTIRSDEWLVAQSWVVSQAHHGYPVINPTFPGGTDMTVLTELPNWDWSSLFRPHMWGYLLFGLDVGIAWQWCLPAAALIISCYWLCIALAPRRPVSAAMMSVAVFFTPFAQWWLTPSSQWSLAWPLLAMAGTVWVLRDRRLWIRILWATGVGYTAVTLAMGLYIPFILPGVLVFLAFAIGYFLRVRQREGIPAARLLKRAIPLFIAGVLAIVIVAVWLLTRLSTVIAIQSTVYPGQRLDKTGSIWTKDPTLGGLGGAIWDQALKVTSVGTGLGLNSSESAGVILLSLFLVPALIWFVVRSWRREGRIDWVLLLVLAVIVVVLAYLFIPGWDALAHLLFLDRVPAERFRIVFVVLLPLVTFLVIERVDDGPGLRRNIWVGALCAVVALATTGGVWLLVRSADPAVIGLASKWKLLAVLLLGAVVLLFWRRTVPVAIAAVLAISLVTGWGVNPVYRGALDLGETPIGEAVSAEDGADPGTWVGVGSAEVRAILTETGVSSLSGVQNYPSAKMWHEIDPSKKYENEWNRLAHVQWVLAPGEPVVTTPQPDVVTVTFDACSAFAQKNVRHVLAETTEAPRECLRLDKTLTEGNETMSLYTVVPHR